MKKVSTVLMIAVSFAMFFTSCSDPLDYQAVQKEKAKVESGFVETPDGYSRAVVAGLPEELSVKERLKSPLAPVRIATILPNGDTTYAAISSEIVASFLGMGDSVFVNNNNKLLKTMGEIVPDTAYGRIVSVHKLLGRTHHVCVLIGNCFSPIRVSVGNSRIPEDFLVLDNPIMIETGNEIFGPRGIMP